MHGFDEFFGNLYHLNAEEEPEDPDYPKDPEFKKRFGPRGVLHCWADGKGGQKIEDTGPLTKKRMETIDDEVTEHALRFIDEAHKAEKPFFVWYNTTRDALPDPLRREAQGQERPGRLQRRDGRARREHRQDAEQARRARHRRRHHRHVLDRQRRPLQHLAGCRHHAVPQPRRTPTGKAAGACRRSCAGRARSRPARW